MRSKLYIAMVMATIIATGTLVPTSRALAQDDPSGAPTEAAPAPVTILSTPGTWTQTIDNAPGMGQYRWWDEDFCWDHTGFDSTGKTILSATLEIYAWDVDSDDPFGNPEVDIISADGHDLGSLVGSSGVWTTTSFPIDAALAQTELEDGVLSICIDIDSTHTYDWWAVTVGSSTLTIDYAVTVPVDIRPASCPNPLNVNLKGVLPVAVLGTADLDVCTIMPCSIMLEGVAPLRFSIADVATPFDGELCGCTTAGPDGYPDFVAHFAAQDIVAAVGPVTDGEERPLQVMGQLEDGTPIIGADCVRFVVK